MRSVMLLLLLSNLAILLWGVQQEAGIRQKPSAVTTSRMGELILLNEIRPQMTAEAPATESDTMLSSAEPEIETLPAAAINSETTDEQQPETTLQIESQEPAARREAEQDENILPEADVDEQVTEVVVPPVKEIFCGILGPIESGAEARTIIADLESYGATASLRREGTTVESGYWVVIPPYGTRREAKEAVATLQKLGITDIRRFFKGELLNGISLGMFSRRANAERRRQQIQDVGFPAEMLPRRREILLHWVDYRVAGVNEEDSRAAIATRYPELQSRKATCPRIVTSRG